MNSNHLHVLGGRGSGDDRVDSLAPEGWSVRNSRGSYHKRRPSTCVRRKNSKVKHQEVYDHRKADEVKDQEYREADSLFTVVPSIQKL